jgi:hypothetical protein
MSLVLLCNSFIISKGCTNFHGSSKLLTGCRELKPQHYQHKFFNKLLDIHIDLAVCQAHACRDCRCGQQTEALAPRVRKIYCNWNVGEVCYASIHGNIFDVWLTIWRQAFKAVTSNCHSVHISIRSALHSGWWQLEYSSNVWVLHYFLFLSIPTLTWFHILSHDI